MHTKCRWPYQTAITLLYMCLYHSSIWPMASLGFHKLVGYSTIGYILILCLKEVKVAIFEQNISTLQHLNNEMLQKKGANTYYNISIYGRNKFMNFDEKLKNGFQISLNFRNIDLNFFFVTKNFKPNFKKEIRD